MDFYDVLFAKKLNGEGGGSSLYTCSINFVNNSESEVHGNVYIIGDNGLELVPINLQNGDTYQNDCVVVYDTNEEAYYIELMLYDNYTVSNTVNCTYIDGVLVITDISIPSSCTVTFE